MKYGLWSLAFLAACSSPQPMPESAAAPAGRLSVTWLQPQHMEVRLDGLRYEGSWSSETCRDAACRGVYRSVPKYHRRHIERGQASLAAADGRRLECAWVSRLPDLEGSCTAHDGRVYRLVGR